MTSRPSSSDVVVPTPDQAKILRIFCERGHLGWLSDVSSYRLLMQKLHECIQEIQMKAVTRLDERRESVLLDSAPLHAELERAHACNEHLERQLQQRALPGCSADSAAGTRLDGHDGELYNPDAVLELQRRMAQMSEAATADLHAALDLNTELKGKVRDLEESLMASAIHAAEKQLAHGAEVACLEQQLREGAAVSAEKTRLLLHAEEHIKRLQRQGGAWLRDAAAERDGGAAGGLPQELALLRLQLAKQRVGQEEAEALHRSQLAEAQGRLVEAQQELERKGQELWEAVASKAGLWKDLETRSSQVRQLQLELEQRQQQQRQQQEHEERRQRKVAAELAPAPASTALHPGVPQAASRLVAAATDLLQRLDSTAASTSGSTRGSGSTSGGWMRRAAACLAQVDSAASRLLDLCGQESTASSQQEAAELLLRLLEQQQVLLAALQGALDSACSADLLLQAAQSQVEQLTADAHKVQALQQQLQRAQEEKQDLRLLVEGQHQELAERQQLLDGVLAKQQESSRQAAALEAAVRSAEERASRLDQRHQHQMEAVQEQVHAHMEAMAAAYKQDIQAIQAQLATSSTGLAASPHPRSPHHSPGGPGGRPHSVPLFPGSSSSPPQQLAASLDSHMVHTLQQRLEQLLRENAELKSLQPGAQEHGQLLQAAYTQLSKLQAKYKALKQSYVKQTLRQHAINQSLLQQGGSFDNEKENLALAAAAAAGKPPPQQQQQQAGARLSPSSALHTSTHTNTLQGPAGREAQSMRQPSPQSGAAMPSRAQPLQDATPQLHHHHQRHAHGEAGSDGSHDPKAAADASTNRASSRGKRKNGKVPSTNGHSATARMGTTLVR